MVPRLLSGGKQYTVKDLYKEDLIRYGGAKAPRFQKLLRKCQQSRGLARLVYQALYQHGIKSLGIEIPVVCQIGPGLYIGHAYGITVNPKAVIGANCNLHKGVTIGQENRGPRKGAPTIGNSVWIGVNATIVGNVTIGDDVLIAPNTYVNCDVPAHSVVLGNPCIIRHKDDATEGYISRKVEL